MYSSARDDTATVISTEAKRSGEISLQSVARPMVAGDLSTLRFIRAQSLCPIPARSFARDDDVGGQHTVIPGSKLTRTMPRPRHFDRSGAEWRNLTTLWVHAPWWQEISRLRVSIGPKIFAIIPAHSPARDDDVGGQHTVIPGSKLTRTMPRPRHFDRSEAEWRNLTPKCSKPMVAGDLPALRFMRAQSLYHSYRRVPPLEMTQGLEAYHQNKS